MCRFTRRYIFIVLRIDKGSPGGALYLGTCIHNHEGLITLCVVSLAFLFHLAFFILPRVFPRVFPRVLDTNMLVSKTREKTREKHEKNTRKTREKSKTRAQRETMFLYYTMRWVKTRVSCVLVAFWSRFGHV